MADEQHSFAWMDLLWLAFLGGLAVLEPIREPHKQLVLLGIGLFQIFETRILKPIKPSRRGPYSVLIKILLATLLVAHTGNIESSYYLIYYLPVVSAAMYFGVWGTLLWTALASAAYCSFLISALKEFQLAEGGANELAIRNLFFFPVAIVVNRFVTENRRQALRHQKLAETLAETNRRLQQAQADARRSERLAALGQLSAGLAHEIRNPLGVIKGSAEMLTQKLGDSNELGKELAGYIVTETNRLSALVTRFLDFARPLHADLAPQDVTAVLDRALNDVAQFWKGAGVEVKKDYANDIPTVPLDESLCEQAFVNIVQNAYDAMEANGGGILHVSARKARANAQDGRNVDGVEVRIEDTGP